MDIDFNKLAYDLINKNIDKIEQQNIDVITGGGGMTVLYALGVLYYLKALCKLKIIHIGEFAGASSGTFVPLFYHIDVKQYSKIHKDVQRLEATGKYHTDFVNILFDKYVPKNIHKLLNGKVHFRTHTFSLWNFPFFFKREDYTTFKDKHDLIQTSMCSCTIPKLTHDGYAKYYKGKYHVDGCVPKTDIGHNPDKLYINLFNVEALAKSRFVVGTQGEVEGLVLKGLHDAHLLFSEGRECSTLYWHKPHKYHDLTTPIMEHAKKIYALTLVMSIFAAMLYYFH
jgi:hypothetical protein